MELYDIEHELLLRRHKQRVDQHDPQEACDDCAAHDGTQHDRDLAAHCRGHQFAVAHRRHGHDREPNGVVQIGDRAVRAAFCEEQSESKHEDPAWKTALTVRES